MWSIGAVNLESPAVTMLKSHSSLHFSSVITLCPKYGITQSSILWDITPCTPSKISRFGVTWRICLLPALRWFLAWLILRPWRGRPHVTPQRRLTFNGLHGVISQKIDLFMTTAGGTSNPTYGIIDPCLSAMNCINSVVMLDVSQYCHYSTSSRRSACKCWKIYIGWF
jgi:hypothetical protein